MKITILGSGSAFGVPFLTDCWLKDIDKNDKKNYRLRSSFYLEDENNNLLVECGPDFRQQTITNKIKNIENIFISHGHTDHMIGVWELIMVAEIYKKKINLWGNEETIKIIETMFPDILPGRFYKFGVDSVKTNQIKYFEINKISNLDIIPLKGLHNGNITSGFRYKNFAFTSDLEQIPISTEKFLYNLDLWLLESNNLEYRDNGGHTHLELALKMIEKYKPKKAVLTHLSHEYDYEKITKLLPNNVELAYDGKIIDL